MSRLVASLLVITLSVVTLAAESPKPPWQRLLQGEDAKKVEKLEEQVTECVSADRWMDAIKFAEEVYRQREHKQGKDHWEVLNAQWEVRQLQALQSGSAEQRKRYLSCRPLWQKGLELENLARYPEALALRQKVLADYLHCFGEDFPDTATAYNNLGMALGYLGKFDEAEENYHKALAVYRKTLGEQHPFTAFTWNNLASVKQSLGKLSEAEEGHRKALEIRRSVHGEDHIDTASSYNNLAGDFRAQGKFAQAEQGYRHALAICRKVLGEEHLYTAVAYGNVANALLDQGALVEAERGHLLALALKRKKLGEQHPSTASTYNSLARLHFQQGKYVTSEEGHRKALEIRRRTLGEEHPDTISAYGSLALALDEQGKQAEAEQLNRKVLELRIKRFGERHPDTAIAYNNLAAVLPSPERLAEAEQLYRQALKISREVAGEEHLDTARITANLGRNLELQGNFAEAEQHFRTALAIRRKNLGEGHRDVGSSYGNLATILKVQGKYTQAEEYAWKATALFDKNRLLLAASGLDRAAITSAQSPVPRLVDLLIRNGKPKQAWEQWEASLGRGTGDDLALRLHRPPETRELQTQLNARLQGLERQLEKLARLKEPTKEQQQQREQLLDLALQTQNQLLALQRELETRYGPVEGKALDLATLQCALPEHGAYLGWHDLEGNPNAVDPNGDHWAVLVKSKGDPIWVRLPGSGKNGAWTVEDDRLPRKLQQALTNAEDWESLARRLKAQRLDPLADHLKDVRHLIVLPSNLADVPLEVLTQDYIVSYAISASLYAFQKSQPRGRTAGLVALGDPTFSAPGATTRPLPPGGLLLTAIVPGSVAATSGLRPNDVLLQYGETTLSSLADLQQAISANKKNAKVTVWRLAPEQSKAQELTLQVPAGKLGVLVADAPAPKALVAQRNSDSLLTARNETWKPLPGARYEVSALSKLFAESKPTLLLGSDASETKLAQLARDGTLSKARFIHLATHGQARTDKPLTSRIILARDNWNEDARGELLAEQVLLHWNLNAELVTLSACQTGLGKYESGEGYVGFSQALLLSGTRSVCLSLWNVSDMSTALLMEKFYDNLLTKKMGKAEALADAKKWLRTLSREEALKRLETIGAGVERGPGASELPRIRVPEASRDQPPYAHPFYWAPFILVGERN